MNILIPKNLFLRVKDKFVADFIDHDKDVPTNPTFLYKKIFAEAHATGICTLPQAHLAARCKFSVRALQNALRRLVALKYVSIKRAPGSCNSYVLLHSHRVQELLTSYDLIESTDWYPRASRPCESAAPRKQPALPPVPKAIPTHLVQGGGEPGAHPSYNVDKKDKSHTPLSPLQPVEPSSPRLPFPHVALAETEAVPSPSASGRGDSFSCPQEGKRQVHAKEGGKAHLAAFAALSAVWPVKKDLDRACRAFCSLARAGQLPPLEELLVTVERFAREDRHWRNGYAPLLSNWLRGRRWLDEPLPPLNVAPAFSSGVQPAFSPLSGAHTGSTPAQAVLPLPSVPASPLEPAMREAAQALSSLWPSASHVKVMSALGLARVRGLSFQQLVERARAYVQSVTTPRVSSDFSDWLQGALA